MKNFILFLFGFLFSMNILSQCETDITNPYFINFEPEVTVSCDVDLNVIFPVALDECDDSVEIAWYQEITAGICENNYDILRVYRAFDNFGNQSVESQIIHVVDEGGPLFSSLINKTIDCSDSVVFDTPQVSDNCSNFDVSFYDMTESVDSCTTNYIRIWQAIDSCGNFSNTSQTITTVDLTAPIITGEIYLEFPEGTNIDTNFITVTDCSQVTITYTELEYSGNNFIRNYTVTDFCGNVSTFEQVIHIDTIPPPDDDEDDDDDDDKDDDDDDHHRVAICHREGNGSYHTIYVNQNAVQAHLNHGDYLGPCTEMIMDWNTILPNSDLEMRVIKGYDNKYKKFVKVK